MAKKNSYVRALKDNRKFFKKLHIKQQKKEQEEQLRIQKFKKFEQKVADKINAMTPEEREKFLVKLTNDLEMIKAQILDTQSDLSDLKLKPNRELSDTQAGVVFMSGAIVTALTAGLITGSCCSPTFLASIGGGLAVIGSAAGGAMAGVFASAGILSAVEMRLIRNSIVKLRMIHGNKKLVKLNDDKLRIAKQIEIIESLSGKPEGVVNEGNLDLGRERV